MIPMFYYSQKKKNENAMVIDAWTKNVIVNYLGIERNFIDCVSRNKTAPSILFSAQIRVEKLIAD